MSFKAKTGWASLAVVICILALFCYGLWSVERKWAFVNDAQRGDIGKVRAGLDAGMSANTVSNIGGISALRMAVIGGHQNVIALLLERGADPTDALGQAIQQNRPQVVTQLISKGANVNDRRHYPLTPLHLAKEQKHTQIVAILRAAGATE